MAAKVYRPGRHVLAFLAGLAIIFGLVTLGGNWKPALGLDLQGGTRISLTALGSPSATQLEEARQIIDQRVNGSGVSESEVFTQGGEHVVVEIPGENRRDLIDVVKRQARLGFRLIACSDSAPGPCAGQAATTADPKGKGAVAEALAWRAKPDQEWIDKFNAATCPSTTEVADDADAPGTPLVACGENNEKFLLSEAAIEGKELNNASPQPLQNGIGYEVKLTFKAAGAEKFSQVSQALHSNNRERFAMVLDGEVISAPTMNDPNLRKTASISGDFNQESATELATSLKFGALPVAFEDPPTADTVGPSLAGDQLSAGLVAGGIGLGLVMLYCLLYYRGLGAVVLASLAVAAAATYGLVLLLSEGAGFTLTLPGIAGLIIAVGITADSFIIFFERIRDEMREGKTMRVAVETGWVRARQTRLAANVVSLLSAVILYTFATGVVKGFGFALGLSTLIDLAVLFWFTKPLLSWLARFHFFNGGGKLSGLSTETLGMDVVTAGGKA
ncbi:protein translocase subunit SecD [Nocardioides sp.]|uniref:protein translocase subunit SecD n=1 Tax=Nocardioides sp. TaxID=35761 RepID=UPI002B507163|nr:protein translocase subunit SecD [Nocardioides sp.]HSX68613.1 protein translocase subunit SecD [Nocardioides sp.]